MDMVTNVAKCRFRCNISYYSWFYNFRVKIRVTNFRVWFRAEVRVRGSCRIKSGSFTCLQT